MPEPKKSTVAHTQLGWSVQKTEIGAPPWANQQPYAHLLEPQQPQVARGSQPEQQLQHHQVQVHQDYVQQAHQHNQQVQTYQQDPYAALAAHYGQQPVPQQQQARTNANVQPRNRPPTNPPAKQAKPTTATRRAKGTPPPPPTPKVFTEATKPHQYSVTTAMAQEPSTVPYPHPAPLPPQQQAAPSMPEQYQQYYAQQAQQYQQYAQQADRAVQQTYAQQPEPTPAEQQQAHYAQQHAEQQAQYAHYYAQMHQQAQYQYPQEAYAQQQYPQQEQYQQYAQQADQAAQQVQAAAYPYAQQQADHQPTVPPYGGQDVYAQQQAYAQQQLPSYAQQQQDWAHAQQQQWAQQQAQPQQETQQQQWAQQQAQPQQAQPQNAVYDQQLYSNPYAQQYAAQVAAYEAQQAQQQQQQQGAGSALGGMAAKLAKRAEKHKAKLEAALKKEGKSGDKREAAIPGANATVDQAVRREFVKKTYKTLFKAILLFCGLMFLFTKVGFFQELLQPFVNFAISGRWQWGVVLAAYVGAAVIAERWAASAKSRTMQYLGLGFYVLAEAILFVPLFAVVNYYTDSIVAGGGGEPNIIRDAAILTLAMFGMLTASVVFSKKDFSFLRSGLWMASGMAMALVISSLVFGFNLGLIFSLAMVGLSAGYILYHTSRVLAHHDPEHHVSAALDLFSAAALMFWYMIRILMRLRSE